jgi:hypothetical protein
LLTNDIACPLRYLHSTEFASSLNLDNNLLQEKVRVLVEEQAIQELQEVGLNVGDNVGVLKRPESDSECHIDLVS